MSLIFKIEQRMELKRIGSFVAAWLFMSVIVYGQIGLKPLNQNPTIESYLKQHPDYTWNSPDKHGKWGQPDTIYLPFFEDFTSTNFYPDSSRWRDNDVFVNRDFPIHPPSYGVATFDYLDPQGIPYSSIEDENLDYGDTLTSQSINLNKDTSGTVYTISDSIFISFYYQAQGLGDFITDNDSLKLLFKDVDGKWNHVWGVRGSSGSPFKQIMFPILDIKYLHESFQFQFVNRTHRWGNNNHWHLDNVYIDKKRKSIDDFQLDNSIAGKPTSLLKHYFSMPYDHFLADPSEAADSFYFEVANLHRQGVQTVVRHTEKQGDSVFIKTAFDTMGNTANTPARGYVERKVKGYDLTKFIDTAYPIHITRQFYVRGNSVSDKELFQSNDSIVVDHSFTRHYAYDDGTPESGFGFNDLKTGDGRIVLAFDLAKADTLRALDFMLTYNTQDVGRQRFVLQVYQDIAFNGGVDSLLFERAYVGQDIYDGIDNRGFFTVWLDSSILLPAGKFYVGWSQERNFNLTVGFDKNNGHIRSKAFNQNIYFNVGDGWLQNSNTSLIGAPMIRPIVGGANPWMVSTPKDVVLNPIRIFPNPTNGLLNLNEPIKVVQVRDLHGRVLQHKLVDDKTIDISELKTGLYIISIQTKQNRYLNAKIIKE
jgi:hypothetical protein